MNRPLAFTSLILFAGLQLSLLALVCISPILDYVQSRRLRTAGMTHSAAVADDLQHRLDAIALFAASLPSGSDQAEAMTQNQFAELAAPLLKTPGIHSVEWSPNVAAERRSVVEEKLGAQLDQNVEIMTYTNSRTHVIPEGEATYPVQFVSPMQENTSETLGYQRGNWAAFVRAKQFPSKAFIAPPHLWYRDDISRQAVFAATGFESTDENAPSSGSVCVTLSETFAPGICEGIHTHVTATDITTPLYDPIQNEGDRQRFDHNSERLRHVTRQQIGSRLFQFETRPNSEATFRPAWVAWVLFFLTNVAAFLIAIRRYHQDSEDLRRSNDILRNEVNRRVSLQRHLQATLDFREQEREMVAHDIHDGFVQDVIGAQMFIESAMRDLPPDQHRVRDHANTVAALLVQAIEEARKTINYLKPRVVDEVGLLAALDASVDEDMKNYQFQTNLFSTEGLPRLPLLAERLIFRMIREAVCNVRQHSGCTSATVCISTDEDDMLIEISDTGSGFDRKNIKSDCFGLAGITQRAEVLNGRASINTSEFGTRVEIRVPIDQPEICAVQTHESLFLEA